MQLLGKASAVCLAAMLLVACGAKEEKKSAPDSSYKASESVAAVEEKAPEKKARSGEEIYKKTCFICHASGAANAPKLGDKAAWRPRLAQGMDVIHKNSWDGFKAMPPRGNCFDCTKEELESAVQYMVDSVKKK